MNDAICARELDPTQPQGFRKAGVLSVSRDVEKRELCIRPASRLASGWTEQPTLALNLSPVKEDLHKIQSEAADLTSRMLPVCVKVHSALIKKNDASSLRANEAHKDVTDTTAAALAAGMLLEDAGTELRENIVQCTAAMLCERIATVLADMENAPPKRFHDWQMSKLQTALASDLDAEVKVTDIASQCGLSACHFSRLFKATYGLPLHKFLMRERIRRAQGLLIHTDAPVSQIALACGFADQSCFTRRFTTITGLPPATWRRRIRMNSTGADLVSGGASFSAGSAPN